MANETPETVRQIMSQDETVHDIEAPKIVPENIYTASGLNIVDQGHSAIIHFNELNGNGGRVEYNEKGNMSIESLTKHVNIEAKKAVQIKPTTNIIFDSSRRIQNDKGNEVHLEFIFDDYDSNSTGQHTGDDEQYAELKVEARTVDIRCYDHGGIALQPCGKDNGNKENKIKFESSRTSPLGTAEESVQYSNEGGKGLEFGTFNNEHTSLFTGDYRFNKDGYVYAVTRETPVTVSGKTDYPTQTDDFKDVLNNDLKVKWETIVKTAKVFEILSEVENPDESDLMDAFNEVFNPEPVL